MKTVHKYELSIYKKPTNFFFAKDEFIAQEVEVLAENDRYIVLNDSQFTKLEKKGDGMIWSSLNKPNIKFKTFLSEKGIFYTVYSTKKKRVATIQKEITAKAEDQYGWLFSTELDLSILKEPTA